MRIVYLAELRPGLTTTGAEQVLRYSSSPRWTRADGVDWLPTLAVPFRRSTQVFDGAFQDQPQDWGALEVAISRGHPTTPLTTMAWDGRPVKIWRGTEGQNTAAMTVVFDGTAQDVAGTKKRYQVTLRGPNLDMPVLKSVYDGSGLAQGTADLRNSLVPMLLGTGMNLEPVYVNRAKGIFQYHGYGAAGGIQAVYDSGSQLGAVTQDYATYALLDAAVIPAGRFATCNALGMGRHGGEITGVLTIDATGAVATGLPGSILKWLTITHAGVAAGKVKSDSLDWLDGQVPHAQDIYVTEQVAVEELARDLMLRLGGYVWFTDDGRFTVGLVRRGGAPVATLDRLNIAEGINLKGTAAPAWVRRQGYQRSWRKHSFSEVRTPREITPRGSWVGGTTYQYYDMVEYGPSSYVYVASVAGNAAVPGTDPAVWTLFQNNGAAVVDSATAPTSPVQGMLWRNSTTGMLSWYNAGAWASVADVTSTHTAAAVAGQGTGATANNLTQLNSTEGSKLGGIAAGATVGAVAGTNIFRTNGTTPMTQAEVRTPEGTAAAVTGQGPLATASTANWQTQVSGAGKPSSFATANVTFTVTAAAGAVYVQEGNSFLVTSTGGENGVWLGSDQPISGPFVFRFRHNGVGGVAVAPTPIKSGWAGNAAPGAFLGAGTSSAFNWGGDPTGVTWTYAPGALHEYIWDGRVFRYLLDGVSKRTVTTDFGTGLYYVTAIFNYAGAGNRLYDVEFFPTNDKRAYRDDAATVMGQAEIRTPEGTAAAIAGQGVLATQSQVYFDGGYIKESLGGANATLANFRTPNGTAAAVAGQGALATMSALDLESSYITNKTRLQGLHQATGRILSTNQTLQTNNNFGLRAVSTTPGMTASVVGGTSATVTFDSGGVLYPDTGGSIALPSASFPGLALSTQYFFWRNMATPDSAGNSGGSYGYSTTLTNALAQTKMYLGYYTTPAAGGTGGGGGGFGDSGCVAVGTWVLVRDGGYVRAEDVRPGDRIMALTEDLQGSCWAEVTSNEPETNHLVRLEDEEGLTLTLSVNTPMTLEDHSWTIAGQMWGRRVATRDRGLFAWRGVRDISSLGRGTVRKIACGNATFGAGDEPGRLMFSHNPTNWQKP